MGVIERLKDRVDKLEAEVARQHRFCDDVEVVIEAQNTALETLKLPLWRRIFRPLEITVLHLSKPNSTPGSTTIGG